jgi:hypothetical protein
MLISKMQTCLCDKMSPTLKKKLELKCVSDFLKSYFFAFNLIFFFGGGRGCIFPPRQVYFSEISIKFLIFENTQYDLF